MGPCFQKRIWRFHYLLLAALLLLLSGPGLLLAAGPTANKVGADERCPVCGMFVAKYPDWLARMEFADGRVLCFDGVKDLLVYHHRPAEYGADSLPAQKIWVQDYYSLEWIDGRAAFYVIGSDVYGPMGHEFIPFATRAAAENFRKDHKGKEIFGFSDISAELVESLRGGQTMR